MVRLRVPADLTRTWRSTNCVEWMIEICRHHSANVKRWASGTKAPRWCAARLSEAKKQFRRVNGHARLRTLCVALDEHARVAVTPPDHTAEQVVAV
ncbi:transposase, mutator type [mine drainage metagenome]|uniref:Transposase, mutator type n=1 Tax=mine drainage metagenome TaxID=410659 RepID=T0ZT59_9ZZZZ